MKGQVGAAQLLETTKKKAQEEEEMDRLAVAKAAVKAVCMEALQLLPALVVSMVKCKLLGVSPMRAALLEALMSIISMRSAVAKISSDAEV